MFTTAVYALNQGSFHRDKAKAVVQGVLIVRGVGYRVYHVRPCRLCFLRIKFHGYRNPPLSIAAFINRLRGLLLRLRQLGFETSLLQKSFNKFFSRHGLIVEKYGAALVGDEISNPGLNCTIVSLHYLFIAECCISVVSWYVCAYNFILSARIICLFITLTYTFSSFINVLILLCVIFLTYSLSVTVLTL